MEPAPIILITGVMASGKSTVAQHLAERLQQSVHLRGDVFRRMMVRGRVEMSFDPDPEALNQLQLRYQAASQVAGLYSEAGFSVVYQDNIFGSMLAQVVNLYRGRPFHVVVLAPTPEVVMEREQNRRKTGYSQFTVEELQSVFQSTPRIGAWVDNSDQSVDETIQAIQRAMASARIRWDQWDE